jgi:hypothetical protein
LTLIGTHWLLLLLWGALLPPFSHALCAAPVTPQHREAGGVEALLALMKAAPLDAMLEHAMGALHNVMLTGKGRDGQYGEAYGVGPSGKETAGKGRQGQGRGEGR